VVQTIGRAEVVIVNKVVLDRQVLERLPATRLVCVIATGFNNVDLEAASECGIRVCNVRDYAAASVSQHVFLLVLALYTRFLDYQRDINAGAWQAQSQFCLLHHPMRELAGKTLGLVGYGHIARAVETIALAFGLDVIVANSVAKPSVAQAGRVPLDDLLQQADIVSLHCPLTPQTQNLIAREQLALMKNDAIIINTARGGIINERDLLRALGSGQIGGAGIDCLTQEPPAADHPMVNADLANLIVTPHNAWGTVEARQRLVDGTLANIAAFIEGRLDTEGNPSSLNP
jgi:glycerate dehydrogenase